METKDAAKEQIIEVTVPDIGGAKSVTVIEINTAVGKRVEKEETLLTLESEKASMEMPSPMAGIIREIKVKEGDHVKEGSLVALLEPISRPAADAPAKIEAVVETPAAVVEVPVESSVPKPSPVERPAPVAPIADMHSSQQVHASPAVRKIAREFGVDLSQVAGSGRKQRITTEDVQQYVKRRLAEPSGGQAFFKMDAPVIDFSQFGETQTEDLSRIKKISAQNLHRNWVTIPHVTQFDEADITELEAFRNTNKAQAEKEGFKLTPLVFLMKAVTKALQQFPAFNSSLSANGEQLILKKYFHIGVAVDTPRGLVVPVVRDVDKKSLFDLAKELGQISAKARALKLTVAEMQGSSFTISSLGGIGGTAFTPIINAPDVAILGVSKSQMKPVYEQGQFVPKLMLPLSLSYDHRVIDGAEAARFISYLSSLLTDIRRIML